MDEKTSRPVTDLTAGDFRVLDGKTERQVESAEFSSEGLMDVMLLLDTSLLGEVVQPAAASFIKQLQPKEQMAIVSFHSSAEMIQDFTSSRDALMRALAGVRYGNTPRVLDGLFAAIDGGFQNSAFRRVILLLTAGVEGPSRTGERTVVRMARRNSVAIYPVYVSGRERSLFRDLAQRTGGVPFNLPNLHRNLRSDPAPHIFEVARGRYTLSVRANLGLGEDVKVEINRKGRYLVSVLPLE